MVDLSDSEISCNSIAEVVKENNLYVLDCMEVLQEST